jgi:hypothetical protein
MAKHVLQPSADDLDFDLIGITTAMNQYETVAVLNRALAIDLTLEGFVPMQTKDGKLFNYSLYAFDDEALGLNYSLIPNASNLEGNNGTAGTGLFSDVVVEGTARLIRELPRTNYFLLVKGEITNHLLHKILETLQKENGMYNVDFISVGDLPSRKNLIF